MRFGFLAVTAILGLAACDPTDTLTKHGGMNYDWQLSEVDGAPVDYSAVVAFGPHGSVNGMGPCNGFSGSQRKPYPWIAIQVDFVEELYCSDIDDEEAFLTSMMEMTLVEVSGDRLLMSNDAGREMAFRGH
ncbi:META domain-containing protein [Shimia sagamensis]|uniref:Heat shock protein HslJ n=1 Tax=Shimia sagamensis TaxID=1566352 RepID=A0ABY1NTD0_9RHOB|nr:META domain-containing protein [Shimia sagamensis]SMP17701.1 Heat shock protein HslJ [Shimia sagamensis]